MKYQKLPARSLFIIVTLLFLVSCQVAVHSDGDVQDILVQVTEPIQTTTKTEQFPLPNCGGTDRLVQSLGTYASASRSATLGSKATLVGGGEVGIPETIKLKLEIQVELAYQQMFESANSRIDSIEISAAKGSHVIYTIVWEEQIFESTIRYSIDDDVYEVPYTYRLSIPKIDTSVNVPCSAISGEQQTPPNSPTEIPELSSPPSNSNQTQSTLTCQNVLRDLQNFTPGQTILGPATLHPFNGCAEMASQLGLVCIGYWGINIKTGQSVVIPESVSLSNGDVLHPPSGTVSNYGDDAQMESAQAFWLSNCK